MTCAFLAGAVWGAGLVLAVHSMLRADRHASSIEEAVYRHLEERGR